MAEQLVAGAWIAELHAAVLDADAAVRTCLDLRATALDEMRSAQQAGDPQGIVDAHWALEAIEHDLDASIGLRDGVGDLLARELADQPCASRVRLLPSRDVAPDASVLR